MSLEKNKNKSIASIILISVLISFLIGGTSGAFFGYMASEGKLGSWLKKNLLGQETSQESFQNINTSTIEVEENSATIKAVEKINSAVVSIVGTKDYSKYFQDDNLSPFDYFFYSYPFSIPEGKQQVSGGTGFIISSEGIILTNKHVVSDDETEYSVVLNDGNKYDAEVLAKDPTNDLAFLKIEANDLKVAELGDSSSLEIGQTAIAIGNALGEYRNTVTKGIISGLSREITASSYSGTTETLNNTIQTDAAINPGNSGGPLINLAGQVIGVNTAISQEGQLLGFAIPINEAKKDIESIKEKGKIVRPYLGVRYVIINERIKKANDLSVNYGALLVKGSTSDELAVVPGSPADKAGLEENDIILEFGGITVNENNTLAELILEKNPGDQVEMKILHDGEEKKITASLGEWSAQ